MKNKKLGIAFIYNVRHKKPSLADRQAMAEAEFDEPSTINDISLIFNKLGYRVYRVEANEESYIKLKKLKTKIDLAFNIAEGIYGHDREAQIPAMLEMLRIPYVGSKPLSQAICLNKAKTKEILSYHHIPTPKFQLINKKNEKLKKNLEYPLIVKPNSEGSSKGIFNDCLVKNKRELHKKINEILINFRQPALVEEFLRGREFTMGLIGNDPIKVLPLVEINFLNIPKNLAPMDSYEVKWLVDNPKSQYTPTATCPAKISKKLFLKIKKICFETKKVLEILDWCRIDLRLDKNGAPNILEVNQIPGIIPDPKENSRFPLAARVAGYTFDETLDKIIKSACQRYNILIK